MSCRTGRVFQAALALLLAAAPGFGAVIVSSFDDVFAIQRPVLVPRGESLWRVAPHHAPFDGFHEEHYFAKTGDVHHFAWFDRVPSDEGPIVIKFDYRDFEGYANRITPDEMAVTELALAEWTRVTGCKVRFERDESAPAVDIINIGKGDLEPFGYSSGHHGVLALGGGEYTHGLDRSHTITEGIAWLDYLEPWDTTIGNDDLLPSIDFFSIVAHEIGHAVGLGHTGNTGTRDIMDNFYTGELTSTSKTDRVHVRSVYGKGGCPLFLDDFETGDPSRWSEESP